MNPNDYYRLKSAEITEADVRLVAACISDKKHCASCSYFEMDLGKPRGQWYTCSLHKEYIVDDSQAENCPYYWKIFTPKPERNEVTDGL